MVEGKSLNSGLQKDQHEVIIELYGSAPLLLSGFLPNIKSELAVQSWSPVLLLKYTLVSLFIYLFIIYYYCCYDSF